MTSNQLADLVLYHTGHIVVTDMEARCKVCEGTGIVEHPAPGFTYPNVQHKRRCSGLLCVKDFLHDAKGANFPKQPTLVFQLSAACQQKEVAQPIRQELQGRIGKGEGEVQKDQKKSPKQLAHKHLLSFDTFTLS